MIKASVIPMFQTGPVPYQFFRQIERDLNHLLHNNSAETQSKYHLENDVYWLSLDLPGVNVEDIQIETAQDKLQLTAIRKNPFNDQVEQKYSRQFVLPKDVDLNKIQAHYHQGVLRLAFPKSESMKPKKITVTTGELPGNWPGNDKISQSSQE